MTSLKAADSFRSIAVLPMAGPFSVPGFRPCARSFACRRSRSIVGALEALHGGSFRRVQDREKHMGTRLYVGNLSFSTTELELREAFSQYGTVAEAKLVTERETGRPRGFGFVDMGSEHDAQRAIDELNGRELGGRALTVNEARERTGGGGASSRGRW
jgi:cold-inducible RNA-binding protein